MASSIGRAARSVQRQRLDQRGQPRARRPASRLSQQLVQQPGLDAVQAQPRLQVRGQRPAPRGCASSAGTQSRLRAGQQVEVEGGAALRFDGVAQARRRGIDQAALDAVLRDHEFAAWRQDARRASRSSMATDFSGWPAKRDARSARSSPGRPPRRRAATSKPQFAGRSGATAHAARCSHGTQAPSEPSRDQLAPPSASTTAVGVHAALRPAACRSAAPAPSRGVGQAQPAMAHVELHALRAQPVQPGAQQRRGLHVVREHPAGAADEGVDAQAGRPVAQLLRREARAAAARPARARAP